MINSTLDKINQKPEAYRKKLALALSSSVVFVVFGIWITTKGVFQSEGVVVLKNEAKTSQLANVQSVPSPIDNSKKSIMAAIKEINSVFDDFKVSVSSVLVPFVTGIEVYDRE